MTYTMAEFTAKWSQVKAASALLDGPSLADRVALCERDEPGFTRRMLDEIGPHATKMLAYSGAFWLRPKQQMPPGDWLVHLHIQGRGGGKTRKGAQWIVDRIEAGARELVFVGPSEDDIKQYMVGGNRRIVDGGNGSGFLDVLPPWIPYHYREDDCVIELPDHGAVIYLHSAEVPEFRGPNPDTAWGDEPIKWRWAERLFSNLRLATRSVGKVLPQIFLSTSPKRQKLLRDLVMDPDCVTYHGRTDENRGNVHERWFASETKRLKGTRQGEEELGGELLGDDVGALFKQTVIDSTRVAEAPTLERIVVAVDPASSTNRTSDDTGIVAAGRSGSTETGEGYVLADETDRLTWDEWGTRAVELAIRVGASAIVMERNKYGQAVSANIRTSAARLGYETQTRVGSKTLLDLFNPSSGHRIQLVEVFAMGDKSSRAGPVQTLYEARRVHHVGKHPKLEDDQTGWDPKGPASESPNSLDALVHAMTELFELDRPVDVDKRAGFQGLAEANVEIAARSKERTRTIPGSDPIQRLIRDDHDWYADGLDRQI